VAPKPTKSSKWNGLNNCQFCISAEIGNLKTEFVNGLANASRSNAREVNSKMDQAKEFHNLDDTSDGLFRELAPGVTTRIFSGEQAMLSVVSLAPNAQGRLHHHPEEQWGVLLEGSAVRVQDGEEIPVKGDFWRTPGNVPHTMHAGPEGARVLDVFSPPRPGYEKTGSGFASS
jgi:quercetin dioxygenase-like cupin family protein